MRTRHCDSLSRRLGRPSVTPSSMESTIASYGGRNIAGQRGTTERRPYRDVGWRACRAMDEMETRTTVDIKLLGVATGHLAIAALYSSTRSFPRGAETPPRAPSKRHRQMLMNHLRIASGKSAKDVRRAPVRIAEVIGAGSRKRHLLRVIMEVPTRRNRSGDSASFYTSRTPYQSRPQRAPAPSSRV